MSVWTHITGALRIDAVVMNKQHEQMILKKVHETLGKTCNHDSTSDVFNACNVPRGSEGSLQYYVHQYDTGLPWAIIGIWGDLRDYDNVDEIKAWWEKVCKAFPLVRQGVLVVRCEASNESHVWPYVHADEKQEV